MSKLLNAICNLKFRGNVWSLRFGPIIFPMIVAYGGES